VASDDGDEGLLILLGGEQPGDQLVGQRERGEVCSGLHVHEGQVDLLLGYSSECGFISAELGTRHMTLCGPKPERSGV
jgi:hypothetical protein